MKVYELIERLKAFDPELEVMILDGFNAGGIPREINVIPSGGKILQSDADVAADCEGRAGEYVITMGYGCY